MKVVQVSGNINHEGAEWTTLFSSVEKALEWINGDHDGKWWVDYIDVEWVGVDDDETYEHVCTFLVEHDFASGTETLRLERRVTRI